MSIRPCPDVSDCPPDQFGNLSAEAPDFEDFVARVFNPTNPPLLRDWTGIACNVTYVSHISQLDADLHAAAMATGCEDNPICNTPQGCCVPCPDGTETCFTVPGGLFCAITQEQADAEAHQFACAAAIGNKVCLSNIPRCTCVGKAYTATIKIGRAS